MWNLIICVTAVTSFGSKSGWILCLVFIPFQNKLWLKWNVAKTIDFFAQQNDGKREE